MKKTILLILIINSFSAISQISVTKKNGGASIVDGQIITYTVATDPEASLDFYVHNNTSSPVFTKIKLVSATNYSGTNTQLCYLTDCFYNIVVGQSYPDVLYPIAANSQNGNYDHFMNNGVGNGTNYPMDFVLKVYALDAAGVEYGNSITFTYRFDPTLPVVDFSKLNDIGVEINNTLVENFLELTTTNNISIELFDLNGKKVYSENLRSGNQNIDLSSLAANVYILNIIGQENKKESIKIIKK